MKTRSSNRSRIRIGFAFAASLLLTGNSLAAVSIAAGPYFNPTTGHRYYRLANGDWNSLRTFAVSMGGDLVTINDDAENAWIRANVVGNSKPFIGLNDAAAEGTLAWADGTASAYRNWRAGEPANTAAKDYVNFDGSPDGTWTIVAVDFSGDAIVELSGPVRVPGEAPTIQAAVNVLPAAGIREIELAAGTFNLSSSVDLANLTLRGGGRGLSTINGPLNDYIFVLRGAAILEDLTLVARSGLTAVMAFQGQNRLRGVELTASPNAPENSLLWAQPSLNPAVILENCEFHNSDAALVIYDNGTGVFASNTIFRDLRTLTFASGPGLLNASNCVVARCGPDPLIDSDAHYTFENTVFYELTGTLPSFNLTIRNSNFPGGYPGVGNFPGDPRFVNAAANDFRLLPDSPCIDRGNIFAYTDCLPQRLTDFAGNDRVTDDPGHANFYAPKMPIDVGAFEFVPPTAVSCPGDLNHDSLVDDLDFQIFLVGYNQLLCE